MVVESGMNQDLTLAENEEGRGLLPTPQLTFI